MHDFGCGFCWRLPSRRRIQSFIQQAASVREANSTQVGTSNQSGKDYAAQAERYYEADNLPLFEITFPRLNEAAQKTWLAKLYADGDFAFFSVAVRGLGANSPLLADFAEKAYTNKEIAFFSILADCMDETELELWLDRALEDGKWSFQSMLFDRLDKNDEFDGLKDEKEKEWEAAQEAEYQAVGVTMDGKDYYYQGQLVNIFLDIRANKSFYTLNMNPAGTVSIKIIRDAKDKITSVSYMAEAEVTELLEDMSDDDDDWQEECKEVKFGIPRLFPSIMKRWRRFPRPEEYSMPNSKRATARLTPNSAQEAHRLAVGPVQQSSMTVDAAKSHIKIANPFEGERSCLDSHPLLKPPDPLFRNPGIWTLEKIM